MNGRQMTPAEVAAEIRGQIDELQLWFARRPYGFTEKCSPEQLQQWNDRVREEEHLIARLEMIGE